MNPNHHQKSHGIENNSVDADYNYNFLFNFRFKDGQEITASDHFAIKNDGDSYILRITGAVTTDSASYKVKAKNIYGTVDDDVRVDVKCGPKITKHLQNMTVTEHDKDVTFDVKVEAFPKPTVKW